MTFYLFNCIIKLLFLLNKNVFCLYNTYMKNKIYVRSRFRKLSEDDLGFCSENWKFDMFGKPDIYIMVRGVKCCRTWQAEKQNDLQGLDVVIDKIPTLSSFEEVLLYREEIYDKVKKYGYKKRLEIIQNSYKK